MTDTAETTTHRAILALPHRRVQNANAISSPLTWGFPAMTAFVGLMSALERRLGPDAGMTLHAIGVVCHAFEAQVTDAGFTRAFHLTRNPVLHDGRSAAIVEEGRVHLDITLVFDVEIADRHLADVPRQTLAQLVAETLAGMRLAGGSVMPPLDGPARRAASRPRLELVPDDPEKARQQFRSLARRWLPGFALVSRDDLLVERLQALRGVDPAATALDAWLDLNRWNSHATKRPDAENGDDKAKADWTTDARPGWIVPIPVGYSALTALQDPGTVRGARDMTTPFRFVESVWSIGQWISPHRLQTFDELVWAPDHDPDHPVEYGLYRCVNAYRPRLSHETVACTDDTAN